MPSNEIPQMERLQQVAMANKQFVGRRLKAIKQEKGNIVIFEFEGDELIIVDAHVMALGLKELPE